MYHQPPPQYPPPYPPPYNQPYPFPPPYPVRPPISHPVELKTTKGLGMFNIGFLILAVGFVVLFAIFWAAFPAMAQAAANPDDPEAVMDFVGIFFLLIGGFCLISVLATIGGIIAMVGMLFAVLGKDEFGRDHSKNVINALVLTVLWFVIGVVGSAFAGVFGPGAQAIVSVISAFCLGLGLVYVALELLDPAGKRVLWVGLVLFIAAAVFSSMINLVWIVPLQEAVTGGNAVLIDFPFLPLLGLAASSPQVMVLALFVYAFRRARKRILTGQVMHVMPVYPVSPGAWPQPYTHPYAQPVPAYQPPYQSMIGVKPEPGVKPEETADASQSTVVLRCPSCTGTFRTYAGQKEFTCPHCGQTGKADT